MNGPSTGFLPVEQRTVGWPYGECVRACYASILRLPIDAVPKFDPATLAGFNQMQAEQMWLRSLGLHLKTLPPMTAIPRVEHLISGISARGLGHRCVGFAGRVIWDPNPAHGGLIVVDAYHLLIPFIASNERPVYGRGSSRE